MPFIQTGIPTNFATQPGGITPLFAYSGGDPFFNNWVAWGMGAAWGVDPNYAVMPGPISTQSGMLNRDAVNGGMAPFFPNYTLVPGQYPPDLNVVGPPLVIGGSFIRPGGVA